MELTIRYVPNMLMYLGKFVTTGESTHRKMSSLSTCAHSMYVLLVFMMTRALYSVENGFR